MLINFYFSSFNISKILNIILTSSILYRVSIYSHDTLLLFYSIYTIYFYDNFLIANRTYKQKIEKNTSTLDFAQSNVRIKNYDIIGDNHLICTHVFDTSLEIRKYSSSSYQDLIKILSFY